MSKVSEKRVIIKLLLVSRAVVATEAKTLESRKNFPILLLTFFHTDLTCSRLCSFGCNINQVSHWIDTVVLSPPHQSKYLIIDLCLAPYETVNASRVKNIFCLVTSPPSKIHLTLFFLKKS